MSGTAGGSVSTPGRYRGGGNPRPYSHPVDIGIAEKGFETITVLRQATLKAA